MDGWIDIFMYGCIDQYRQSIVQVQIYNDIYDQYTWNVITYADQFQYKGYIMVIGQRRSRGLGITWGRGGSNTCFQGSPEVQFWGSTWTPCYEWARGRLPGFRGSHRDLFRFNEVPWTQLIFPQRRPLLRFGFMISKLKSPVLTIMRRVVIIFITHLGYIP